MKIYKKKDGLLARKIEGETVIVETNTGFCHVLNSIGSLIWENINENSFDAMLENVKKYIDPSTVDNQTICQDVTEYVSILLQKELIEEKEI